MSSTASSIAAITALSVPLPFASRTLTATSGSVPAVISLGAEANCSCSGCTFRATVAEAVQSALAQTFRDAEVIAVNDGSTDGTLAALEPFRDRIRIITRPNGGISAARNSGVAESSGEYLAFLDCDDVGSLLARDFNK